GRLEEREQELLLSYARARSIGVAAVDAAVSAARENRLRMPVPGGPEEARECVRVLARMSLADGQVSDAETRLMTAFASPYGLDAGDVAAVVKSERVAMYRAARADLNSQPAAAS
ncbi:MAG: hypothetical protein KGL53_08950, partial [Elusimicrobia bacterium]|nr:hypothetical protein [Elusimicrobiota bacterium]